MMIKHMYGGMLMMKSSIEGKVLDAIEIGTFVRKRIRSRMIIIFVLVVVILLASIAVIVFGKSSVDTNLADYDIKAEDISDMASNNSFWNDGGQDEAQNTDEKAGEEGNSSFGDCYENRIAITFDDGPGNATEELLDGLRERGVKATFFLIGKSIENYPDTVKRMAEEGHLIGNHTYSHIQLSTVSTDEAYNEILRTNQIIEELTGQVPRYIRPPYGSYSEKLLTRINMSPILWSVDPEDWNTTNVSQVVRSVVKNVKCGDIILLHDIYKSSVTAALEIIDQLQDKGYVFVTVDQVILD